MTRRSYQDLKKKNKKKKKKKVGNRNIKIIPLLKIVFISLSYHNFYMDESQSQPIHS
jgi:hypothetical protein